MMAKCKEELQKLQKEKEKAVEDYLETHAEEKFTKQHEIKMKYTKMLNMLKNSKDPNKDQKMANYEEKKTQELNELAEELNEVKNTKLKEIKDQYNDLCAKVKIDALQFADKLKKNIMKVTNGVNIVGQDSWSCGKSNQEQRKTLTDKH